MKRRDFLKILGASPLAPSVLMAKETAIGNEIIGYDGSTKTITLDKAVQWSSVGNAMDWKTMNAYYYFVADQPARCMMLTNYAK